MTIQESGGFDAERIPVSVLANSGTKNYPPGTRLLEKGTAADCVYILISGKVDISNEPTIACTCTAVTECRCIRIPHAVFTRWIESDTEVLKSLIVSLAKKNYRASYLRGVELFYPATYLVASTLVKHFESLDNPSHSDHQAVILAESRHALAIETGVSERSVNRSIRELRQKGMVTVERGKIHITRKQCNHMNHFLDDSD